MTDMPPSPSVLSTTSSKFEKAVSPDEQPVPYKTPTLRVRAPRKVIEGNLAAPFRRSHLTRLLRSMRPNAAVKVEPSPMGVSSAVLYAREEDSDAMLVQTRNVTNVPRADDPDIIYRESPYEVRVVGMQVPNFDAWGPDGENELFMYSQDTTDMTEPIVHYDYEDDEYSGSAQANVYVPIPASKSFVHGSTMNRLGSEERNRQEKDPQTPKSINVRFCVLELDKPGQVGGFLRCAQQLTASGQMTKDAVTGISDVGRLIRQVPAVAVAAPALKIASALGKRALHAYAKPDKVFMVDMDFIIANRNKVNRPGEYLRYGYYFFLSEPIEGQLYASVKTPKNVRLLFKRMQFHTHQSRRSKLPFSKPIEAKEYFPLADVSYIVVRVTEPMGGRRLQSLEDAEAIKHAVKTPTLSALFNCSP